MTKTEYRESEEKKPATVTYYGKIAANVQEERINKIAKSFSSFAY